MTTKLTTRRASAVLIALLIMTILVLLSLGINALILREIRVQQGEVSRLTAMYSAESGIERGLLDIFKANVPGFTKPFEPNELLVGNNSMSIEGQVRAPALPGTAVTYKYSVLGQDTSIPCDYRLHENAADMPYGELDVHESVTLPLYAFTKKDTQGYLDTTDFVVDYYIDGKGIAQEIINVFNREDKLNSTEVPDVLRWKVFGLVKDFKKAYDRVVYGEETDALTDYVSFIGKNYTKRDPSQFATSEKLLADSTKKQLTTANYLKHVAQTFFLHYPSRAGRPVLPPYSIAQFIEEHTMNYLMLTNVLTNKLVFVNGRWLTADESVRAKDFHYEKLAKSRRVQYRVRTKDRALLACQGYQVSADGFYRDAKQSINMRINHDTFMPVFDFALYRTSVQ